MTSSGAKSSGSSEELALYESLFDDLSYQAFSTVAFRSAVAAKLTPEQVAKCLVTYLCCGNNPSHPKRKDKVGNPKTLSEMVAELNSWGVTMRTTTATGLTLTRIAKAYAPALLEMRTRFASKLNKQVASSSPLEQCDACFLGMQAIPSLSLSQDYAFKLGVIITKAGFPKMTDDDLNARVASFQRIAAAGLEQDTTMRNAFSATGTPLDKIKLLHIKRA